VERFIERSACSLSEALGLLAASDIVRLVGLGLRLDHEQLGSNANVADGGIRKGIHSDETRPIIPPWPLPPLWPKRAAYGVAGLRSRSGQGQARHALMAKPRASKPQPEPIPLNI